MTIGKLKHWCNYLSHPRLHYIKFPKSIGESPSSSISCSFRINPHVRASVNTAAGIRYLRASDKDAFACVHLYLYLCSHHAPLSCLFDTFLWICQQPNTMHIHSNADGITTRGKKEHASSNYMYIHTRTPLLSTQRHMPIRFQIFSSNTQIEPDTGVVN